MAPVMSCRQPIRISPPSEVSLPASEALAGVLAGSAVLAGVLLLVEPPHATRLKAMTSARVIARIFFMVSVSFFDIFIAGQAGNKPENGGPLP